MERIELLRSVLQLSLILLLFASSFINAGTTGKLAGKVLDSEVKEPVIGATVLLQGTHLGAVADLEGYYYINNISSGIYTVVVTSIGYHKVTIQKISIRIDQTTRLDVNITSHIN